MRKYTVIAAAALVFAILPLGAVAAPGDKAPAKPHSHWFAGSVSAVGSNSLSVDVLWTGPKDGQLNGTNVTVSVSSDTEIVSGKDKTAVPLSSIQPGDLVGLRATSADATLASLTATHIRVWCNCHWIGGTISSIGASSINVQVARTGPYDTVLKGTSVTIQVNGSTSYIKGKDKTPISPRRPEGRRRRGRRLRRQRLLQGARLRSGEGDLHGEQGARVAEAAGAAALERRRRHGRHHNSVGTASPSPT